MKITAVAAVLALLLSFYACSGNSGDGSTSEGVSVIGTDVSDRLTTTEAISEIETETIVKTTARAESTTKATTTATTNKSQGGIGDNLQKYVVDIVETGQYTMTVEATSDGLKLDYVGIISGENTMQEMNMLGLMTIRLVSLDGKCYLLSPKGKRYAEISFEEFEKQLETIKNFSLEFKGLSLTDTQKVTKNGKEYVVETYKDADGKVSKYYFRNNALELIEIEKNSKSETMKYTISPEIDKSKIAVPSGYKKVANAGEVLLGSLNQS